MNNLENNKGNKTNISITNLKDKNMKSKMISAPTSLRFIQTLILCAIVGTTFLVVALFSSSEAQAADTKTAEFNYLGTDGVWHYVDVYSDEKNEEDKIFIRVSKRQRPN